MQRFPHRSQDSSYSRVAAEGQYGVVKPESLLHENSGFPVKAGSGARFPGSSGSVITLSPQTTEGITSRCASGAHRLNYWEWKNSAGSLAGGGHGGRRGLSHEKTAVEKLEAALSLMALHHSLGEPDKTEVEQLIEEALRLLHSEMI